MTPSHPLPSEPDLALERLCAAPDPERAEWACVLLDGHDAHGMSSHAFADAATVQRFAFAASHPLPSEPDLAALLHQKADLLERDDSRDGTYYTVRLTEVHDIIDEALAALAPDRDAPRERHDAEMLARIEQGLV